MRGLQYFSIPFTGLKAGKHDFDYHVDDEFFEHFESSEIREGNLEVHVTLDKNPRFLELTFIIEGIVIVPCDRCLENFKLPVKHTGKLYFRFGDKTMEQSDEVIILSTAESEVNIAQYVYEFIHLSLPYRRIHPEINGKEGCDAQMIQKLDSLIVNENKVDVNDPRWDKLKELINKN